MYIVGFLHSSNDDYLAFWIGANSRTDGEGFKWSNGAPFVFYNWFPGNPLKQTLFRKINHNSNIILTKFKIKHWFVLFFERNVYIFLFEPIIMHILACLLVSDILVLTYVAKHIFMSIYTFLYIFY